MTTYFLCSALVATLAVLPGEVLAFEATLESASSQKLVAVVELAQEMESASFLSGNLPAYSHVASGAVVAYPSPETQSGQWAKPRLAQRRPIATGTGPVVLQGEASYYSRAGCLGCSPALRMANGQPLDDTALTMAIGAHLKHLVGRRATVTNVQTGQAGVVMITDTGGFYQARYGHRVADLTIATKQAIGMQGGLGEVKVVVH